LIDFSSDEVNAYNLAVNNVLTLSPYEAGLLSLLAKIDLEQDKELTELFMKYGILNWFPETFNRESILTDRFLLRVCRNDGLLNMIETQ